MKSSVKAKAKPGVTRDLFAELSEGMEALADARQGKRTLRTVRPQLAKRDRNRK